MSKSLTLQLHLTQEKNVDTLMLLGQYPTKHVDTLSPWTVPDNSRRHLWLRLCMSTGLMHGLICRIVSAFGTRFSIGNRKREWGRVVISSKAYTIPTFYLLYFSSYLETRVDDSEEKLSPCITLSFCCFLAVSQYIIL